MFNWLVEPWPAFRSRSPAPFRLPLAPLHRFPFCFLSKLKLCSFYPTSMARMFGCWEAHKPSFTLRPIPSGESATVFLWISGIYIILCTLPSCNIGNWKIFISFINFDGGFCFCFLFVCFHLFFISWRLVTLQYCSGFCPPYMQNRKRDTDV